MATTAAVIHACAVSHKENSHFDLVETPSGAPALVVDSDDPGNMSLVHTVRKYPKRTFYILLMIPAILLIGYDTVILGSLASMPIFDAYYGAYLLDPSSPIGVILYIPATWLGLWTGLGSIGNMFGAFFAGWVHDRFGRRVSMILAAILTAVGVTINYCSTISVDKDRKRAIFLIARIFEGFSIGQLAATAQTYLSEIAPHSLRGPTFAVFLLIYLSGQLIAAGIVFKEIYVVTETGYKICILSQFAFSVVVFACALAMPESPVWLVRVGNLDWARKSEKRLERAEVDVDQLVDELIMVVEQEKHESSSGDEVSILQCFKGVDARRTWIVILANSFTNCWGIILLGSSTYFYELLGMEVGLAMKLLEGGIGVGMAANFISIWTITKFNRRSLLMGSLLVITMLWLGIGISGCFTITPGVTYFSAASMMAIVLVAGLGAWPVVVTVASEASSLRLRGQSQAIGWIWQNLLNGVFGIVLPHVYTPTSGNSKGKVGFLFSGLSLFGIVLAWLFMPEMRGRTASEIDTMFHERVPSRGLKNWSSDHLFNEKKRGGMDVEVVHVEKSVA